MKSSVFVSIMAGALAAAQRPNLAELPHCGQICVTNMLALAPALGCPMVDGHPHRPCLCSNANFRYAVRDCTSQACGPEDANRILAFAASCCAGPAMTPIATEPGPVITSSALPSVTESPAHPKTAIPVVVSTFTSENKTYTTTIPGSIASAATSGTAGDMDMDAETTTSTTVEIAFENSTSTSTTTTSSADRTTTRGVVATSVTEKGAESEGSPLMTFAFDAVFVGVVGLLLLI